MEVNSSDPSRKSIFKDEFTELLFSWTLEEIFDDNLYEHQVVKIPESFESVHRYLASYFFPLLEETRSELASALETVYKAPYAEVASFRELKHETQLYNVKVDRWENRISDRGKEPYRTLPGDFVLLSTIKPESASDLQRVGCVYTFASVRKIYEDESGDDYTSSGFKLRTAVSIEDFDQQSKSLYVVHLVNLTTQKRIWNALRMRRNLTIIEKLLTNNDLQREVNCEFCPIKYQSEVEEKFGSGLLFKLNESQREAILASLRKIGCNHQPSVELIWGPPGTGKTSTLSSLLYILLRMNVRTIICAPTNIAITALASRVAALVRNSFKTETENCVMSCPLGDMLIFGNKDNLKVSSEIQEIFLDYRVDRLIECLVPLTGWNHCVSSMLDFLETCVSQYRIFVDNDRIKSEQCLRDNTQQSEGEESLQDGIQQSEGEECLHDDIQQSEGEESLQDGIQQSEGEECLHDDIQQSEGEESLQDGIQQSEGEECLHDDIQQSEGEECLHDDVQQSGSKSFLEFARDRFTHVASPLRQCMLTLFTHLPRSFIQNENCQSIVQLISLLESLESLLFEDSSMTLTHLEAIFLQPVMVGSESYADTSSLQYIRNRCLSILKSLQSSLSNLGLPLVTSKTSTTEFCFQKASLIFCTISSSFKLHSVATEPFHFLVIDEAAQVKECETIIALQLPEVVHAILVGDERQLPATVTSKLSEEAGFGRSLFERLSSTGHPKHLLNVQYRMHPSISRFPNSNFYHGQILDAPNVQSKSYERRYLEDRMFGPYSFINICGGREELDDVGHSMRNMVEVAVIVKLVQKLFKAWKVSKQKLSIGLISPYAAQVAAIQDKLQPKYDNLERFTVKVKSIDGFQGGEEDIIIISTVRSHKGGSIGFLCSPQRTNVALTRARHCLWVLGNESTLSKSDSVWEALVSDAKDRKCFFNADEDRDFGKTILDMKKELEELDDLLNEESVHFQNTRWQVLFSDNFRKSFQKLKFSRIQKLVIKLLLKLASGWRPKKINVDRKCEKSSYLLKEFKVDKYYVVCSIDIVKDVTYKQVLKVWDVVPMNETTKLFKRLDNIFSMYSDDFINRCNDKKFERNLEVPKSWSFSSQIIRFKNPNTTESSTSASASVDCRSCVENSKVSESLLLMKFYILSIGAVNHLLSDHVGREMDIPFEVTDQEREIINFPRSSFILGRSGTGKTTILTMKLYQKLQQYCITSLDFVEADSNVHSGDKVDEDRYVGKSTGTTLHQLFVTVSPKLCYAVKNHVSQLKSFATGNFSGINNFTRMDDIDEMAEFKDIPDTFVGIEQEKYPLIITFQKFLMMLDGTVGNSYFQRFHDVRDYSHYEGRRSVSLQNFIRKNEVTYDRFRSLYWPHFNAKLIKNLDASRVFTEILSHIKGGVQEGEAFDCKRSRQDYISLSESRVSTLSEETRDVIYDIFEDYEKMKLERGDFDLSDFVNDIHLRLKSEHLLGDKMDLVYIDEVQDLTMRQICLFRYTCKNVDEGFVFSGDTAQTIARGIDFRFEDIRSLFYNEFLMKSRNGDNPGRREKGLISDMFNLSQNFRTHTGVLRLAQSVIDLISHYFPQSIDSLPPETSLIYGESPIVIEPGSDENMIMSIFGHCGKGDGKWVGFGADQVILVRDDSARKEITSYVGQQALVLTILECKGLEFQDVLLYNFFGSSPLGNQWRVVYEFLKEKDLLSGDSFPGFSKSRHNILCSELKQLYVAITRTRQRLWICENNVELSKPMLDYWRRLCLVQVRKIDDSLAEAMQRASSPEEWKEQGIKLFWENNFEMAIMCFEKAGEETWEKRAKASGLRAAADNLRGSNPEEANMMLRQAAEIFDSIDRIEGAECFYDLGEYERAGRIYAKGNFVRECLSACSKGNCFDLGLQYIEYWKKQASLNSVIMARLKEIEKIAQEFLENSASECYKAKDNASLMKFVRAFNSNESKRSFLKSLDCLEELLVIEEELGNFTEAIEIAKSLGDILYEINLLEKAEQFSKSSVLIISYVLSNCLWISGNRGWPMKSFPERAELLNKAKSIAQKVSETFYASISAEVNFFLYELKNLSGLMQCYIDSQQCNNPICGFLSVRKLLDAHFQVYPLKYEWDPKLHLDQRSFNERISRNQVSGGTLFYLWTLWKSHCLSILEYLDALEKSDVIKSESTALFCHNYFGVRFLDNSSVIFHLRHPDAAWITDADKGFVRQKRKAMTLEARYFASAARKYWHQELVFVGLRVLGVFQELFNSNVAKHLPKYFQSTCLLQIFDIAKFFVESKSINRTKFEDRKLEDFLQLSTKYFEYAFPLDPRVILSENMISLKETELSKNLLEEIVSRNISRKGELTCGQIGRSVMIMLGTSKPNRSLYDGIAEKLSKESSWNSFIENLKGDIDSDSPNESKEGAVSEVSTILLKFSQKALFLYFLKALEETYSTHWRQYDYISPSCFFYLVERLLIFVPHSKGFFFTTKSSFVEYLTCLPSDADPSAGLVTSAKSDHMPVFNFVVSVVQECLSNGMVTSEWIRTCQIDCKSYFPVLMLRLFVILCLSCLNSNSFFNVLFELLRVPHIRLQLPNKFSEALRYRKPNSNAFVAAVAGAFKGIGDPLVIVSSSENNLKFIPPDAVFLDLRSFSYKNEIMKTLFPRSPQASHVQPTTVEKDSSKSSSIEVPPFVGDVGKSTSVQYTEAKSNNDKKSSPENAEGNLQINWGLLHGMSKALESLRNGNDGDLKSIFLRKKLEVEDHIKFVTTAVAQLTEQRSHSGEDEDLLCRATDMIDEFNTLCSLLATSDFDSKTPLEIDQVLGSLEARKAQLDTLLSQLTIVTDQSGLDISEEIDDKKISDTEDGKSEDSACAVTTDCKQDAECNPGKGKGKKNKKSKKGKGGRRK